MFRQFVDLLSQYLDLVLNTDLDWTGFFSHLILKIDHLGLQLSDLISNTFALVQLCRRARKYRLAMEIYSVVVHHPERVLPHAAALQAFRNHRSSIVK